MYGYSPWRPSFAERASCSFAAWRAAGRNLEVAIVFVATVADVVTPTARRYRHPSPFWPVWLR
eukprot:7848707-Lingulodinium_polyedra.AAC.1